MTIIQSVIASGGKGRPPTLDVVMPPNTQYINEGQYNAFYINVANNYPNTTLWWKVVNITTNNTDWVNNDTPSGTVTVYGDSQFPVFWQASNDLTTDGQKQYGVILASDPGFVNVLYTNNGLYVNDYSQWTFNQPYAWYYNSDTNAVSGTSWSTLEYRSVIGGNDNNVPAMSYPMSAVGTPALSGVTYANGTTGQVWNVGTGNYLMTPDLNGTGVASGVWNSDNTEGVTFEMWFYPIGNYGAGTGCCLMTESAGGWHDQILELNADGTVSFKLWPFNNNTRVTTPNGIVSNSWNHVWAQYDGSSGLASLVLNNYNSVSSAGGWIWQNAATHDASTQQKWLIGGADPNSQKTTQQGTNGPNAVDFTGKIGSVRIANYAMDSHYHEDKAKYLNYPAPLLYLDATDPRTATVNAWSDKSGYGRTVTLYGGSYETRKGYNFTPSSYQYVETSNLGDLTYWTFDVWFRLMAQPAYYGLTSVITTVYQEDIGQPILGKINFSLSNYGMGGQFLGQNFAVSFFDGQWHYGDTQAFNVGEWYNVVGTWDGNNLKTYVNSEYRSNRSYPGLTTSANGGGVRIARRWDGASNSNPENFAPVEVAIARVYNTVLAYPEQITENYNEHRLKFGK